jgi:hypothetical protein
MAHLGGHRRKGVDGCQGQSLHILAAATAAATCVPVALRALTASRMIAAR